MSFPVSRALEVSDSNFEGLLQKAKAILADDEKHPRKYRGQNFFKQIPTEFKNDVSELVSHFSEFQNLRWHFEVFYSVEAVGMHNDRNHFVKHGERCDRGFILPLEWRGNIPKTKYYDLFFEDKVNWTGRGFKTLENEYKLLTESVSSDGAMEMTWNLKEIIFFDSRQIHEACTFSSQPGDYKLSINGLGYSRHA